MVLVFVLVFVFVFVSVGVGSGIGVYTKLNTLSLPDCSVPVRL